MRHPKQLVVIGGGEHARVVIDAAFSCPDVWQVVGIVDPKPCRETIDLMGVEHLGDEEDARRLAGRDDSIAFVIGVGGVGVDKVRTRIAFRLSLPSLRWATVVHANAWVSPTATLRPGAVALTGATVNAGAVIDEHAILNTGCIIEHDVRIGAFAQVGPGAVVGGAVAVGQGSYLGMGCSVRDHVRIGDRVVVGMGAVVLDEITSEQVVVGCPARPIHRTSQRSR